MTGDLTPIIDTSTALAAEEAAPGNASLAVHGVALPPALPAFARAERLSLAIAGLAHVALIASMLTPERRIGGGGNDLEAIGIEIVTVAPALDARSSARGRGTAAAGAKVSERDGAELATPEEKAARDTRQDEQPSQAETAPPPADLTVPNWQEPPRPFDASADDPIIATVKSTGAAPDAVTPLRPSVIDRASSVADSIPATELLAQQQGGAAARGRETTEVAAAVMAAASAGRRDDYGTAVYAAIQANPPPRVPGLTGSVKVEFAILPSGKAGMVRVARSSGSRQLDEAAIAAVRGAPFPPPPAQRANDAPFYDMTFTFQ